MITFWTAVLALTVLLYVLLDGFDLGVGILFGLTRNEDHRRRMLSAISPVWDGNETWLVLAGTILFGAFPRAYALLLSAFYLPIMLMLGALILRGVAFEFRYKATRSRWLWDLGFAGGSLVATFVAGRTVGALAKGLPIENGIYIGGPFGWLSPVLTAVRRRPLPRLRTARRRLAGRQVRGRLARASLRPLAHDCARRVRLPRRGLCGRGVGRPADHATLDRAALLARLSDRWRNSGRVPDPGRAVPIRTRSRS